MKRRIIKHVRWHLQTCCFKPGRPYISKIDVSYRIFDRNAVCGDLINSYKEYLTDWGQWSAALSTQVLFDTAAQRSDILLSLGAPSFLDISAQRSYLILDRRSALKTSISARFFFLYIFRNRP